MGKENSDGLGFSPKAKRVVPSGNKPPVQGSIRRLQLSEHFSFPRKVTGNEESGQVTSQLLHELLLSELFLIEVRNSEVVNVAKQGVLTSWVVSMGGCEFEKVEESVGAW
jgi:hypothetical protein